MNNFLICSNCHKNLCDLVESEDVNSVNSVCRICYNNAKDMHLINHVFWPDTIRDQVQERILKCETDTCGTRYDREESRNLWDETNTDCNELFWDYLSSLNNLTYADLVNKIDMDKVEFPDIECPNCGNEIPSQYYGVMERRFIRHLNEPPPLPSELNDITTSTSIEEIEFYRPDCSNYFCHLTKPNNLYVGFDNDTQEEKHEDFNACEILYLILRDSTLKASTGPGMHDKAVCFTDKSLHALKDTLIGMEKKVRNKRKNVISWSPYGLMFHKSYVQGQNDIRPVLPLDVNDLNLLIKNRNSDFAYRVIYHTSQKSWLHEREFRIKGDFKFETEQAIVIVPTLDVARQFKEVLDKDNISVKGFLPIFDIFAMI